MAIVVQFEVSGMSDTIYDDMLRELEAAGQGAPAGRLHHVSYGAHDNLQVIDIFESPAALEAFGRVLEPILKARGVSALPRVEPAYNLLRGG